MMFATQSVNLKTVNGEPMTVHLVSTGGVIVKTKFRQAKTTGLMAKIAFMLDRKYTDWLPIWVMIIQHPEGTFIIDTGENSNISDPKYFNFAGPMVKWFNTTQYKFCVDREEEIDRHLERLGISKDSISCVFLTHLHLDHIDGLRHFPGSKILVSDAEWLKPYGDLPQLYPSWFQPTLISLSEKFQEFDKAFYVTRQKDLVIVETPGHTWHHCSVILKTSEGNIFFGADICYEQQQLITDKYSGANASHRLATSTYSKVKSFCRKQRTIFIPSHEAAAASRLSNREFL